MSRKAPLFELLLIPIIMWMNNTFYRSKPVLESFSDGTNKNNLIVFFVPYSLFYIKHQKSARTKLRRLWHRCLVCNCVLSLRQAGEGLGVGCGTGDPIARPGSAPEETAEGAELWFLPAQDTGTQVWSVLSHWYPVYHIPRRLYVRHPSGFKVRHAGTNI